MSEERVIQSTPGQRCIHSMMESFGQWSWTVGVSEVYLSVVSGQGHRGGGEVRQGGDEEREKREIEREKERERKEKKREREGERERNRLY